MLFQAVRRAKRWPVVIPIYDGRRCPDCGSLVIADKGQELHRAWHEATLNWQEQVNDALAQIAAAAGLNAAQSPDGGEISGLDQLPDEQYDGNRRVSWRTLVTARAVSGDDYQTVSTRGSGDLDDDEQ